MESLRVRIAVVGDTHDEWDQIKDEKALIDIKPDLVLFTGDFGDENVALVRQVGNLNFTKAVILGNHDCWFSGHLDSRPGDAIDLQLQSLGECHVGYKRLDFPAIKLSIVGCRPFSCGGDTFRTGQDVVCKMIAMRINYQKLKSILPWKARGDEYRSQGFSSRWQDVVCKRYGIQNMSESTERISELAISAPKDHALIFLGHNGPTGLGSETKDICGKDWKLTASGDHGDPDLEEALKIVKQMGSHTVPLVVFGHMHKTLAYNRGVRTMLVTGSDGIVYLNAAVVPRIRKLPGRMIRRTAAVTEHNFTVVDMVDGQVEKVVEVWVGVADHVVGRKEHILLMR